MFTTTDCALTTPSCQLKYTLSVSVSGGGNSNNYAISLKKNSGNLEVDFGVIDFSNNCANCDIGKTYTLTLTVAIPGAPISSDKTYTITR